MYFLFNKCDFPASYVSEFAGVKRIECLSFHQRQTLGHESLLAYNFTIHYGPGHKRGVFKNAQNQMLLFLPQSWKWKMGPSKISFLYIRAIFHFHSCGRMGNSTPLFQIYVSVRISFYSELRHLLGNLFLLHPF